MRRGELGATLLVLALGLGAVLLTRFGGQLYPARNHGRPSHPADPHEVVFKA